MIFLCILYATVWSWGNFGVKVSPRKQCKKDLGGNRRYLLYDRFDRGNISIVCNRG